MGGGGNGETPLNQTKPTKIFRLVKVGLTVVANRTAFKPSLMSEAWVSAELLSNSTLIGSERKRWLNPLLAGEREGVGERWTSMERRGSKRGSLQEMRSPLEQLERECCERKKKTKLDVNNSDDESIEGVQDRRKRRH